MKKLLFLLLITPAYADNLVRIDQVGNGNNISVTQSATDASATIKNSGDYNELSIMQIGAGTKSAYIGGSPGATNNNNSITINQSGTGNNSAIVAMTDSTSNSVASITQSGPDKSFTLSMSGVGVSATVVQTNPTAGDTGSMVIQCYTPPCSGYSYIRN